MPLPNPVVIASGFADAVGCCYRQATDQLLVADDGNGQIVAVKGHAPHTRTVLGSGYHGVTDIELSQDGLHAYVADSPGTFYRVPLSNLNHAAAAVVATGMTNIDQIALDEGHGVAYVCESAGIQKINLATGTKTVVVSAANTRGVLVTDDGRFLLVSSDADTIVQYDLVTHTSKVLASGLGAPRHLTWADAGQSLVLFPVPNPSGTVMKLDLTTTPPTTAAITGTTQFAPYSVAVLSSNQLLIATAQTVEEVDLTASVFQSSGPILLGIGFVPADTVHLPNGYADTTMDPTYFFQVKDSPFGGTLPLQINWQHADSMGAQYYKVFVNNNLIKQPFNDYKWNTILNEFELVPCGPDSNGFYPLRQAGQIWLNNWLGLLLDSTGLPNALNTISVSLFTAAKVEIGHKTDAGRHATVMIDNTTPIAVLEQILQEPGNVVVDACAIVNSGAPTFNFRVTASQPQSHLLGWELVVYWGDNKSQLISTDSYSNHVSPSKLWAGITSTIVPPPGPSASPWNATVPGDPTSTHCAHSFFVYAWDRIINGWGYIHGWASYQKSVTLLF
jgi:hypothetical protein